MPVSARSIARWFGSWGVEALHAVGETIAINLGKSIRKQPRIFLEELQRANLTSRVDEVVGMLGPAFVDQYAAQVKELQLRRKALASVKDSALAPLHMTCLVALDRQISELRQEVSAKGERAGNGN
jgi:ABC-type phosphate transport system auxiliary subunit